MKYDVFISCKSEDYKFARQIYNFLTGPELNYKVFLADAELRKKGKTFYGKVIDAALEASDHLILFASKVEYVTTEYVENEWRLFLEELRSGRKKGNIVTILKGVDTKSLPISLRHIQSIPFDEYKSVIDFLPKFEEGDENTGHRESDDEFAEPTPPTPPTPSLKKWLWMVAALLLIVGGIFGGRAIKSRVNELQFVRDSLKQAQLYQDSLEYVQAERAAFVKDSTDKANAAARKAEANRLAKEKAEKEEAEQERLAEEKAAKEKSEKERIATEKAERECLAAEQAAKEKAEKEQREREAREAAEKVEQERIAQMVESGKGRNGVYKVGDYYNVNGKEGVVFYVDASGRHGKIVSMTQSSEQLEWSSNESEQKQLIGASSETDGVANMRAVQQRPNWRTDYRAFAWCAQLGSGWYLPAIEELKLFTLNDSVHDAVNRTLAAKGGTRLYNKGDFGKLYWSSTEYDYQDSDGTFCAWIVSMDNDYTYGRIKSLDSYVRAVSAF